jgi:hypothetical protein
VAKSSSVVLTLNNQEYTIVRATLRLWLQLEDYKEKVSRSAESGHIDNMVDAIYAYISAVLVDIQPEEIPWYDVVETFYKLVILNVPSFEFPLLQSVIDNHRFNWDYEGRTWYIWLNILSSKGWTIEYISQLDIDDAIGIAQEIAIDKQLELETQWAMSEKSVSYDKKGKGKFHPLERPSWMRPMAKELNMAKLPDDMLPKGILLSWRRDDEPPKPN